MKDKIKNQNIEDDNNILGRLEDAVEKEMQKRSYVQDFNDPDLIVRYEVVSGSTVQRNNNQMMNPMFFGPGSMPPVNGIRNIAESVILVEIVTASNQKLVWQASTDLKDLNKNKKNKDLLIYAVEQLFKTYLHRAGKQQADPTLAQ